MKWILILVVVITSLFLNQAYLQAIPPNGVDSCSDCNQFGPCICPSGCDKSGEIDPFETCTNLPLCTVACDVIVSNDCICKEGCPNPGQPIGPGESCSGLLSTCATCDTSGPCLCPAGCDKPEGTEIESGETCTNPDTEAPDSFMVGLSDEDDDIPDEYDDDGIVYAIGLGNSGDAALCEISWDGGTTWSDVTGETKAFYEYTSDGLKTVEYRCTDADGNADPTPNSSAITVDTTPPDSIIAGLSDEGTTVDIYDNDRMVYAIGLGNSGDAALCQINWNGTWEDISPMTITATYIYDADGPKTVFYKCRDSAGNWDDSPAVASISVDTVKPVVSMDGLSDEGTTVDDYDNDGLVWAIGLKNNDTAPGYVVDSGVAQCYILWELGGDIENLTKSQTSASHTYTTDGYKDVYYICLDGAGNQASVAYNYIKIDTTAPVTTDDVDPVQTYGPSHTVYLDCSDAATQCIETRYCVYNEGSPSCNPKAQGTQGNNVILTCGQNTVCKKIIRYYSVDLLLNEEAVKTSPVITLDSTLPSCYLNPLPEYTTLNTVQLSWSGEDPNNKPIIQYDIYHDIDEDQQWIKNSFSAPTTSANFRVADRRKYRFYCQSINSDNVVGTVSNLVSTTVDRTEPNITITPLPQWSTGDVLLEWSVDNPSEIQCYDALWTSDLDSDDNGGDVFFDSLQSWSYIIYDSQGSEANCITQNILTFGQYATTLEDGATYYFKIIAKDKAGNAGEIETSTLMDLNNPECSMNPLPAIITNPAFDISWTGSDSASGINHYDLGWSKNTISWTSIATDLDPDQNTFSFTATQQGLQYIRCIATDNTGKTATSQSAYTLYDTSGPSIVITKREWSSDGETWDIVNNNIVGVGSSMRITAKVTDSVTIKKVTLLHSNIRVSPESEMHISSYEWQKSWVLDGFSLGQDSYTIAAFDINDNINRQTYSFSVTRCIAGDIKSCGSNVGQCSSGMRICRSDNTWGACQNQTKQSKEICDGIDNNCNGIVDESITDLCGSDIGICAKGTRTCIEGGNGQWGACEEEVTEETETCDGLDNDCDGDVDEGCICQNGETQQCGEGRGACIKGIQICSNNQWGSCQGGVDPVTEVCHNNEDDDCDGQTDEGCISVDDLCSNGELDNDEEGIDCGGVCPDECGGTDMSFILIVAGILVLVVLVILVGYFRSQGKDLSWEELSKKWTGEEYLLPSSRPQPLWS